MSLLSSRGSNRDARSVATATGAPGVGFNFGVGNTNVDHGLTQFEVDTYDA